ncbi:methyltransferase domain-containing protein [Flexivirga sp. ID2601S]|uniref:Methyltransferase domain-containing protein n=1 Tax=Flexivirga aerilata TaxID=1656889 RepID=A0A849AH99_9MICO|nr:methyltransferase domain-containing protein [Flexivirga aerilata]NNG37810.1 methyltransferase domain-containing protein [Flexivirga aerilata]
MTPDGCPVELWSALPAGAIPELLSSAILAGGSVLDLGAGVGRLAHPLVAAGYSVTAVDEPPDMLDLIEGAETVRSTIEDLRLGRRFDAVLLASHLVNVPDDDKRAELLTTCRAHVATTGVVLVQRYTREWVETASGRTDLGGGVVSEVAVMPAAGTDLVAVRAAYTLGGRRWEHAYTTRVLDDEQLGADLARVGLRLDRWLSDDGRWVVAVPD